MHNFVADVVLLPPAHGSRNVIAERLKVNVNPVNRTIFGICPDIVHNMPIWVWRMKYILEAASSVGGLSPVRNAAPQIVEIVTREPKGPIG